MNKKEYKLDNVNIMQFVAGILAICEITLHNTVQYKASGPKKDLEWSIWFKSDHVAGILYVAIQNVYSTLIIGYASRIIMMNNQKLHTVAFYELFCLIPSFELPSFNKFQSYLPVFCKSLLNLRKSLVSILYNLNVSPALRASSFSYHTLAKTEATNNTIAATLPAFKRKISKIENKYLRHYVQMLAKYLNLFGESYLREHELILNTPIVRLCKVACVISNHFSNLSPSGKVEMMYAILDEEEICLHILINSSYERIDTIS